MDAKLTCDVASAAWSDWNHVPWSEANQVVRRLQTRIAKAVADNNLRKAKALQRLLVRSTSGKAVAVRRVTENRGRKTPGVDKETWSTPSAKWSGVQALNVRGYRPRPLRRVHIPKANGGRRALGIPTMRDRAMQALWLLALEPVGETTADGHSYGFRPGRSTVDAVYQCMNLLDRRHSAEWVLDADIQGCFDNISHDWMLQKIPMDRMVLRKWLKAGFVEKNRLFKTEAGTPQGGIISPLLANMVLDGLQDVVQACGGTTVRAQRAAKIGFVRYADDFVVTASSKELLEREILPAIERFLAERGLALSSKKTAIRHVTDGFDFLGWHLRKWSGSLAVSPSKANKKAFYAKVRKTIQEHHGSRQDVLIDKLNPILRGWANYHQSVKSSRVCAVLDHRIFWALWQWSIRRHPKKGRRWVKRRYFHYVEGCNWTFASDRNHLSPLRTTRAKRHVKIKAEANPYDRNFAQYFEQLLGARLLQEEKGLRKLRKLWRGQSGRCLICRAPITKDSGWHVHHRVPKSLGGSDDLTNLALLHPTCHRQAHARHGVSVRLPELL